MTPGHVCRALILAVATAVTTDILQSQSPQPADLDRFYSAPSLIGTTPRSVTWSPDSKRVAFLWNTDGSNFLDVFVATVIENGAVAPTRVTTMPRRSATPAARDTTPLGFTQWRQQREALAAELDGGVSSITWHPDGERLLVTFRGDLYLVNAASANAAPQRLTQTPSAESRAVFVGATRVAYLRDGDLHIAFFAGAGAQEPVRLTRLAREAAGIESFIVSPDGSQVMVTEVDRTAIRTRGIPDYLNDETTMPMVRRAMPGEPSEIRRVGIVPVAGGDVTWLPWSKDRLDIVHGAQWSPDGTRLLLDVSDVFVKDRRILVFATNAGTVSTLVEEQEPNNVSAEWQVSWAPDGRGVYFTSDRRDDYHVWYAPLDGSIPRAVTSGEWAVSSFAVAPAGVYITANQGRAEERHLWRLPLSGGTLQRVTREAGTHTTTLSPDGRWAADVFSSDTIPPDLYLVSTEHDGSRRRVTTSPTADFARYRFTPARYVTFASRADGATLHARLLLPPGRREGERVPLIIGSAYSNTARNQFGGRNSHPLWGLDQVLLEKGFAILAVDVAGSGGHGTAFRRRIRLDYGGIDVEDLHSGVEWAVREGIADPARVGIWGSSYGGLLTTMSLFTKPGVYKAGVAGAPATNVWHALTGEQRVMMRPQEQMKEYAEASSHTRADALQGHLMLIHGMRDVVVLYRDSAWLTQYLLQMGKSVELVTLPDASHGWDLEGLAQTRYALRQLIRFFEQHLGPTR